MAKNIGHMVLLNGGYMFSAAHGDAYTPLRINERVAKRVQDAIATQKTTPDSCIRSISAIWFEGKFMMATNFNPTLKCTTCLKSPSTGTKNEICLKRLCNGQCTDKFMRNVVAKNILPELYNTKQK